MALLKRRYAERHVKINDYALWLATGNEVKRAVAKKALETFRQRLGNLPAVLVDTASLK